MNGRRGASGCLTNVADLGVERGQEGVRCERWSIWRTVRPTAAKERVKGGPQSPWFLCVRSDLSFPVRPFLFTILSVHTSNELHPGGTIRRQIGAPVSSLQPAGLASQGVALTIEPR